MTPFILFFFRLDQNLPPHAHHARNIRHALVRSYYFSSLLVVRFLQGSSMCSVAESCSRRVRVWMPDVTANSSVEKHNRVTGAPSGMRMIRASAVTEPCWIIACQVDKLVFLLWSLLVESIGRLTRHDFQDFVTRIVTCSKVSLASSSETADIIPSVAASGGVSIERGCSGGISGYGGGPSPS